jgi:hypothetical protein
MMDTPVAANDRDLLTTVDVIAELCWETHCAWERILDEPENSWWGGLAEFKREAIRDGVKWFIANPFASLTAEHEAWAARKRETEPDHPNLAPYDLLPFAQQVKLRLWRHTILAVIG